MYIFYHIAPREELARCFSALPDQGMENNSMRYKSQKKLLPRVVQKLEDFRETLHTILFFGL